MTACQIVATRGALRVCTNMVVTGCRLAAVVVTLLLEMRIQ